MKVVSIQQFSGMEESLERLVEDLSVLERNLEFGRSFNQENDGPLSARYQIDWTCSVQAKPEDLYKQWSRSFIFHADFVEGIQEYLDLSKEDQKCIFSANYPAFSWLTNVYKSYSGSNRNCLPLGNGTFITCTESDYGQFDTQMQNHLHRDPGYQRFMDFLGSLESDSIPLSEQNNNNSEQYPNYIPIKRYEMDWSCMKLVDPGDISALWSRTFLLHSDWATGIPEYNALSRDDQTVLFKQNYAAFSWMTHAYKCYHNGQARIGLPLGNGSYLPYSSYEYANLHPVLERVYGVVARRIIDQVVIPMFEMHVSFEEYCILKALALFQLDFSLTNHASDVCLHVQKKLRGALVFLMTNMIPEERCRRLDRMESLVSALMDIGSLEYENIKALKDDQRNQ